MCGLLILGPFIWFLKTARATFLVHERVFGFDQATWSTTKKGRRPFLGIAPAPSFGFWKSTKMGPRPILGGRFRGFTWPKYSHFTA